MPKITTIPMRPVKRSIFYLLWLVRDFLLPADDYLFIEEEMTQIHSKDTDLI
jgi:hypothetical protein